MQWLIVGLLATSCAPPEPSHTPVPPLDADMSVVHALILDGQPGPARVRVRRALDAGQKDSRWLFLMGLAHHWERTYARSTHWMEQATTAPPIYPPAWHFLGWARYHSGDLDGARTAFDRHVELVPSEGDSWFGLGVVALESGALDEADAHLLRAIELQRGIDGRQAALAKALARRATVTVQAEGDPHAAISMLREALSLAPMMYEAHFQLARLLRRTGDNHAADEAQAAGEHARELFESMEVRPR